MSVIYWLIRNARRDLHGNAKRPARKVGQGRIVNVVCSLVPDTVGGATVDKQPVSVTCATCTGWF